MYRLTAILAAALLVLGVAAPAVLAAGPVPHDGSVLVSVNGPLDVPAGRSADLVLVVQGDATIAGNVATIVVVNGDVTLTGATTDTLVVIRGHATLASGTVVQGDVRTLDATVDQAAGSTVQGTVRGLETDVAAAGVVLVPAFLLFFIGLALVTVVAALALAGLAARQTRAAEALISRRPGATIVAGLLGVIVLPLAGILAIVTVVGAPLGLVFLLFVLPVIAYVGWIVAAIWLGDWILIRTRGAAEPERPYLAAIIGVVVLGVAGIIPPIAAIASLFGFGAVLLLAWEVLRGERPIAAPRAIPAPTA